MRNISMALQLYTQEHNTMPGPTWTLQNAIYNQSVSLVNYLAPYLGEPKEPTLEIVKSYVPSPFLNYIEQDGKENTIIYDANNSRVVTGASGRLQSIWAHIGDVQEQPADEPVMGPFNIYALQGELTPNEFWIVRTSFSERGHPEAKDIYGGDRVTLYLDGHVEVTE